MGMNHMQRMRDHLASANAVYKADHVVGQPAGGCRNEAHYRARVIAYASTTR